MATTYDKASLVMIPSGYKDDKLYSIKPTDGSGDFTFSRDGAGASPATRVNASGLIEKGRTNEFSYSYTFSNAYWNQDGVTPTDDTIANPLDGSVNADTLTTNASGSGVEYRLRATTSMSGASVYSVSAYVKRINHDYFYLRSLPNNAFSVFDINNGVVSSQSGNHFDANIESVGSGWYRCSISFVTPASFVNNLIDLGFAFSSTNFSGSIASGQQMYVYGAQLEDGLVATDYIETTTAPVSAGLLGDMPRLDYSGGATCPSLLLEPSRVNLFPFSEYASGNTLSNAPTITENYAVSPEGVQNAFRMQDTTGSTFKTIRPTSSPIAVSANSTYTASVFVKKAVSAISTYGGFSFDYNGGTRQISYILFDEYNGTLTAIQSQSTLTLHDVEDFGDYWRFSVSAKDTGSNTTLNLSVYACLSVNGTGVGTGQKDYTAYGLQLESGSYPTSYIPTYGSASTRGKDSALTASIPSTIGQTEGTLFIEYTRNSLKETNYIVLSQIAGTTAGSYQNGFYLFQLNTGSNNFVSDGFVSNVNQFGFIKSGGLSLGKHKIALAYKHNDFALYIDGVQIGTDTSGNLPTSLNYLTIGGGADVFGHRQSVSQALLFKTRLTNAELAALTA